MFSRGNTLPSEIMTLPSLDRFGVRDICEPGWGHAVNPLSCISSIETEHVYVYIYFLKEKNLSFNQALKLFCYLKLKKKILEGERERMKEKRKESEPEREYYLSGVTHGVARKPFIDFFNCKHLLVNLR